MALGLGGEAGEVLEAEMSGNETELKLELGDVLHYATAIGHRYGIDLAGLKPNGPGAGFLPLAVSTVQELIKKYIRDDKDPTEKGLALRLGEVYFAISETTAQYALTLDEVRAANKAKLLERYNSGRFANGRAVRPELKVAA